MWVGWWGDGGVRRDLWRLTQSRWTVWITRGRILTAQNVTGPVALVSVSLSAFSSPPFAPFASGLPPQKQAYGQTLQSLPKGSAVFFPNNTNYSQRYLIRWDLLVHRVSRSHRRNNFIGLIYFLCSFEINENFHQIFRRGITSLRPKHTQSNTIKHN